MSVAHNDDIADSLRGPVVSYEPPMQTTSEQLHLAADELRQRAMLTKSQEEQYQQAMAAQSAAFHGMPARANTPMPMGFLGGSPNNCYGYTASPFGYQQMQQQNCMMPTSTQMPYHQPQPATAATMYNTLPSMHGLPPNMQHPANAMNPNGMGVSMAQFPQFSSAGPGVY
eukprot:1686695-Rhodomonas_salina.2